MTLLPHSTFTIGSPGDVAVDAAGDVFVTDSLNGRVLELPAGSYGSPQVVTGLSGLSEPTGIAVDAAGDLFVADAGNNDVVELPAGGGAQVNVPFTGLQHPTGVAVDSTGDVFVADWQNGLLELPAGGSSGTTTSTSTTTSTTLAATSTSSSSSTSTSTTLAATTSSSSSTTLPATTLPATTLPPTTGAPATTITGATGAVGATSTTSIVTTTTSPSAGRRGGTGRHAPTLAQWGLPTSSSALTAKHVTLTVSCDGTGCAGTLWLVATVVRSSGTRRLMLGSCTFHVRHAREQLSLLVDPVGRRLVHRAGAGGLDVAVVIESGGRADVIGHLELHV